MDLIASFEAKKVRSFHFFNVTDLFGARAVPFLFDISFDEISLPLLGSNFIDDCAFAHKLGGDLSIMAMKNTPGKSMYSDMKVLNFDEVFNEYKSRLSRTV